MNQGVLSPRETAAVQRLLADVVASIQLPASYDVLEPDEAEEDVDKHRRQLLHILEIFLSIDEGAVLTFIHALAHQALAGPTADFARTELALRLIGCVGDNIRGMYPKGGGRAARYEAAALHAVRGATRTRACGRPGAPHHGQA